MVKLRDYFTSDLQTFFNLDEFTEFHNINGMEIPCMIDEDVLKDRPRQPADLYNAANGVYVDQIIIFVRLSDLGEKPIIRQRLDVDEELYLVTGCTESMGLLEITLEANRA